MPWVRFTAAFDWKPKPQVTIGYQAGHELLVTTACAKAAIARGAVIKISTPGKRNGKNSGIGQPETKVAGDTARS